MVSETEFEKIGWRLENSYASLPESLFAPAQAARVPHAGVAILNERLAGELGLQFGQTPPHVLAALLAGQDLPAEFHPIAQAYAGHQFGSFTMLGDGRALLLGEHRTPSGRLADIQLKGSGQTRFSRGGDGRAALGPMLREYIISEAMYGLGIPTTRCLAVITTGEPVYRETIRKGAILVRVAASHIRVGTFEYLAARRDTASVKSLADYAIDRHYPDIAEAPDKYQLFLRFVIRSQAELIAKWQLVGFIHGVMNTDNMTISGETIDYGPCAFMNRYDSETVFSSIDHTGRYSYSNQPPIAQWNLARFAETLLPLIEPNVDQAIEIATEILGEFRVCFEHHWLDGMRRKLGLAASEEGDLQLIQSLLNWMQKSQADFTNTFRNLAATAELSSELSSDSEFRAWHSEWKKRLEREHRPLESIVAEMRAANPAVIPRNHRVEEALRAAEDDDNLAPLHRLLEVLRCPFEHSELSATYTEPPDDECNYRTFCGT